MNINNKGLYKKQPLVAKGEILKKLLQSTIYSGLAAALKLCFLIALIIIIILIVLYLLFF